MSCIFSDISLALIGVLAAIKVYNNVNKGFYKGNERMEGKTVIVTGASAGIGKETAKDLARRGARVVMLCRDMKKGEKARQDIVDWTGNKNVVIKHVDFASLVSVRRCAEEILNEESRIDVLLNNAGGGGLGTNSISCDGLELYMQTNYFGPFLLTNLLLDRIKESAPARIVNVSSYLHKWAKLDLNNLQQKNYKNEFVMYGNSKLANILFTIVLAEKLKGTGVTANSLHPGTVSTEISRNSGYLFQFINDGFIKLFCKNAWEGAQTSIFLCVSPSVDNISGKYFSDCKETDTSKDARDISKARRLWTLSEELVGLKGRKPRG